MHCPSYASSFLASLLLACAGTVAPGPTFAAEPLLAIAPKPLGQALSEFAAKTGLQIVYRTELSDGIASKGAVAGLTVEETLRQLLRDTGLQFQFINARTVAVINPRTSAVRQADAQSDVLSESLPVLEQVVVTGSFVRGAEPAGAHVVTLERTDIDKSGRATLPDVLQALPQNFSGGVNEGSTMANRMGGTSVNYNYGSSVNLRGLGQDSTLVLLDGHRLASAGVGDFVDISSLPLSAVERVEILPDGASATYGSDAMAGVVNIVTRRDFQGAETRARFGSVTHGDLAETGASQLFGLHWGSGHVMGSYEYYRRDNLPAADRPFGASTDLRPFGGNDYRTNVSNPGNIISPAGIVGAIPAGQDGTVLAASQILQGQANLQNQQEGADLLPEHRRHSVFLAASQEVTARARLYFDGIYSHRDSLAAINAGGTTLSVPTSNAFRQMNGLLATNPAPIFVNYSFIDDAGPQKREGVTQAYSATAGLDLSLSRTWHLNVFSSTGENRDDSHLTGIADTRPAAAGGALNIALASSNPATSFNPFGDGGHTAAAVLASIFAPSDVVFSSRFWSANTIADGALFSLPAGPVRLALGGEYRHENFDNTQINRYSSGAVSPVTPGGARSVRAAFSELYIPLFGDANRKPGIERLDLSLSARYDDYSDFGSTTNPKAGLSWSPVAGVTLRGTYGTSFKAPRINDLYTLSTGLTANLPRVLGGPDLNGDGFTTLLLLGGGNAGLRSETGKTWTAGIDLSPVALPALRVHAGYFNVHFEDRIARMATLLVPFANPAPYEGLVYFVNPGQAQVDELVASVATFTGSAPAPGTVEAIVDLRVNNISVVDVDGADLEVAYGFGTGIGEFSLSANASYILDFNEKFAPALPAVQGVDTIAHPIALRGRAGLSWHYRQLSAATFLNYQDGYTNTEVTPNQPIASLTTFDLQLTYAMDGAPSAGGWLDGTKVALSVVNLFDRDPPFTNSLLGGYDGANSSPLGRFAAVELTKSW